VHTNLEVVLVRQGVANDLGLGNGFEDLLAHLVHGILDRGALVDGKGLHGNLAGALPGGIEALNALLNGSKREALPSPGSIDIGRQDAIPGLAQAGVLVPDEAMEGRASALEHSQAANTTLDVEAIAGGGHFNSALLLAVAEEAVRMRGAVNLHARPPMHNDLDVGGRDVGVRIKEVLAEVAGIQLWGVDGMLLGLDVDGVLDRVSGHDDAVVGLGVSVSFCQSWSMQGSSG